MPDTTAATGSTETQVPISDQLKQQLEGVTGSTAKKVLWWILGFFGVLLSLVGILAVLKGMNPLKAAEDELERSKRERVKADLAAKAEAAAAAGAEKAVVDRIKDAAKKPTEREMLEAYSDIWQGK